MVATSLPLGWRQAAWDGGTASSCRLSWASRAPYRASWRYLGGARMDGSMRGRLSLYSDNRLKLGLFGANCSSGRAVTMVPERWSGNWEDCLRLARMADDAGIEFMLPVGRWKGYGGDTDYQGETLETITWASGLLAATRRLTVF